MPKASKDDLGPITKLTAQIPLCYFICIWHFPNWLIFESGRNYVFGSDIVCPVHQVLRWMILFLKTNGVKFPALNDIRLTHITQYCIWLEALYYPIAKVVSVAHIENYWLLTLMNYAKWLRNLCCPVLGISFIKLPCKMTIIDQRSYISTFKKMRSHLIYISISYSRVGV